MANTLILNASCPPKNAEKQRKLGQPGEQRREAGRACQVSSCQSTSAQQEMYAPASYTRHSDDPEPLAVVAEFDRNGQKLF
ncbi:hypothetical protein CYLTODRAFT_426410 [Cylindrobasidium torrendii FP15055 ss-10]|uniref:Uncharacterized protein n=1 Tax=Cylindrobasidium torrendii FP15055 ss-10 TaxID=1314674 RepID=A0A0D7AYL6_9AGAR|nr:hypothetical protein CYLTODRAFT_426410 [Cylindrobasidium torrendii FP15055 ss-10]